jgi:hypothetical protein
MRWRRCTDCICPSAAAAVNEIDGSVVVSYRKVDHADKLVVEWANFGLNRCLDYKRDNI